MIFRIYNIEFEKYTYSNKMFGDKTQITNLDFRGRKKKKQVHKTALSVHLRIIILLYIMI